MRRRRCLTRGNARVLAVLLLAAGLAGCAHRRNAPCAPCPPLSPGGPTSSVVPAAPAAPAAPVAPVARVEPPASGTIFDHRSGATLDFDALAARCQDARVVYVGEHHDQAAHHAFQHRVLAAVAAQEGGPLALGLEMFFLPFQAALDAYVAGEIDEATMLERTEWKTRWGFGWEMYAPMLRLCREKGLAVVALNAPREVTRTVSRQGLPALSDEQRAALPPLDLSDAAHRAFVKAATSGHGHEMKPDAFERMYTAMVIWDETMSSSVAGWLERAGPGSRMVVVAGNGHVADRFGIPARAARKSGAPYVSIVQETRRGQTSWRTDTTYADMTVWWDESAPPRPAPKPPAPPVEGRKDGEPPRS